VRALATAASERTTAACKTQGAIVSATAAARASAAVARAAIVSDRTGHQRRLFVQPQLAARATHANPAACAAAERSRPVPWPAWPAKPACCPAMSRAPACCLLGAARKRQGERRPALWGTRTGRRQLGSDCAPKPSSHLGPWPQHHTRPAVERTRKGVTRNTERQGGWAGGLCEARVTAVAVWKGLCTHAPRPLLTSGQDDESSGMGTDAGRPSCSRGGGPAPRANAWARAAIPPLGASAAAAPPPAAVVKLASISRSRAAASG
jgi:hypothetical protein